MLLALAMAVPVSALGQDEGPAWTEIEIHNPSDRSEVYLIDFDRWGAVDFVYTNAAGEEIHKRTGELVHPSERDFNFDNAVVIELEMAAGETIHAKVRLEKGIYGGPQPTEPYFEQHPKAELVSQLWEDRSFNLAVIAILLFIFAYNLGLFLSTRLGHYRLYLVLMVIVLLETARESGFLGDMMPNWEGWGDWQWYLAMILNYFLCLLAPYLVRNLANLDQHFRRSKILFKIYPFPATGLLISAWISPEWGFLLFMNSIPFVFALMFIAMLINMIRQNPNSTMLFIGSGMMIIGSMIHWMGLSNLIALDDGMLTIIRGSASIVFDTAMSFILGKMLLDLKRENEVQQDLLIRNLRKEQRNQQRLALAAAEAQEREREAIALRLHDDLQNELVTVHFGLMNLEEDVKQEGKQAHAQVSGLVKDSIRKVRHIAHEFMPPSLGGEEGLENALMDLAKRIQLMGPKVDLRLGGQLNLELPMRAMVYRTVQELLSNCLKHSGADRVFIHVGQSDGALDVVVEDNGVGFGQAKSPGRGLETLQANLVAQGGSLGMGNRPEGGARVAAHFSLNNN